MVPLRALLPTCGTLVSCLQLQFGELLAFRAGGCCRGTLGFPRPFLPCWCDAVAPCTPSRPRAALRCLLAFSGRCRDAKACWYFGGAMAKRSVRPVLSCLVRVGASQCWLLVSVSETSLARRLRLSTFLRVRSEHLSRSFVSQSVPWCCSTLTRWSKHPLCVHKIKL